MGLGFELAESMKGTFHRFSDPMVDHALRLTLRLDVNGLRRFARERRIAIEGTILAAGLAENDGEGRSVEGSIVWRLLDENRVPYALTFRGDDDRTYHLRGQRDFFAHNALRSLRTMNASLYDESDIEIGRAVLDFEPGMELPALIRSFRPRLRLSGKGPV